MMMRTTKRYLLLLPLLLAFSCQRENAPIQEDSFLLSATVEPLALGTKADIATATGNFSWTEGDKIAIWFSSASVTRYFDALFTETNAQGKGIFLTHKNGTREHYAVYPASYAQNSNHGDPNLYVVLPENYEIDNSGATWKAYYTTFSPVPMIAPNADGQDLTFKHVGGVLRLTLTNVPVGTKKIVVYTGNKIWGDFAVDVTNISQPYIFVENPLAAGTGENVSFTLQNALTSAETFTLNVPLPVGTHETLSVAVYNDSDEPLGFANSTEAFAILRAEGIQETMAVNNNQDGLATFSVSGTSLIPEESKDLSYDARYLLGTTLTPTTDVRLTATSNNRDVCSVAVDNTVSPPRIMVTGHKQGTAIIAVTATRGGASVRNSAEVTVSGFDGIALVGENSVCMRHSIPISASVLLQGGIEVSEKMAEKITYTWTVNGAASTDISGSGRKVTYTGPLATATFTAQIRCEASYEGMSITSDPFDIEVFAYPAGAVPGVFSVSAGGASAKKIFISRAGLLLRGGIFPTDPSDPANGTLMIGTDQLHRRSGYLSLVPPYDDQEESDLFNYAEANDFYDGTTPVMVDGTPETGWRMLWDYGYWQYLLDSRECNALGSEEHARYAFCSVDGIPGLLIFPDHYTHPADVRIPNLINQMDGVFEEDRTNYGMYEWTRLEDAGVAFLPIHKFFYGSRYFLEYLYYWIGDQHDDGLGNYSYGYLYNNGVIFNTNYEESTSNYYPIRLVKEK